VRVEGSVMYIRHGSGNDALLDMDVHEDLKGLHSHVARGCRLLADPDNSYCMGSLCLRAPA
jgi:hypothetical protein